MFPKVTIFPSSSQLCVGVLSGPSCSVVLRVDSTSLFDRSISFGSSYPMARDLSLGNTVQALNN